MDRLMHVGYVVDFINIGIGLLSTRVFNIADIAITAGALVILVDMLRARTKQVSFAG